MSMTYDDFLKAAWADHGDRPEEVADRLPGAVAIMTAPGNVSSFASLVTHVLGDHLGQWQRGIELLQSARTSPVFEPGSAGDASLNRNIAALGFAAGDTGALETLSSEDRACALAVAASAFGGRDEFKRAIAAYSAAIGIARQGLPEKSPALRALAVGGNNLAVALEEKKDRDAAETEGMIAAAEGGLEYWKQAGTWLETERAEYRLARSQLQAGKPHAAIECAKRCVEVCEANNAPAFEKFFAFAVLAMAQRAADDRKSFAVSRERALGELERVPEDEKQWCESDLKEIQ
jgi:tetratricopeptide (TPR) repeat protein